MTPHDTSLKLRGAWVIRSTWLSAKPRPESSFVAATATFSLVAASLLYWTDTWNAKAWMPASADAVFERGEIWRLWTTLFAHGDAGHLASNSFLFFILGFFLFGYFGLRIFPLAAFFWGGIANLIVLKTYAPDTQLIGASGIVYWMGGTWLVLYYFLSRQKNLVQRCLRTLGVAILLFMPAEAFQQQVSYRTHFVGFVLGLGLGTWHFLWHRARFRAAEVHEFEPEEIDVNDDLPPPGGVPTNPA